MVMFRAFGAYSLTFVVGVTCCLHFIVVVYCSFETGVVKEISERIVLLFAVVGDTD